MGATGGYRAPRAGLLLRHPVQGDRPSDLVLDDRRALDRSNQTHSYVKDVQGQNVRHVLGLDTLKPKGAAPKGKKKTDRGKIVRLFRLPIQRGSRARNWDHRLKPVPRRGGRGARYIVPRREKIGASDGGRGLR